MANYSAKYILSAARPDQLPKGDRPEFAFVGRSNVGKSSLLNTLLGRKGLAKTSRRPGKTQTLNFFEVNGEYYFVDLPGYGYAKVPVPIKVQWGKALTNYLRTREQLRLAVQLVDARHKPSDKDIEMLSLLDAAEVPTLIVATKVDKLKRSERKRNLERIRQTMELDDQVLIVPFSSITGEGRGDIREVIEDMLHPG